MPPSIAIYRYEFHAIVGIFAALRQLPEVLGHPLPSSTRGVSIRLGNFGSRVGFLVAEIVAQGTDHPLPEEKKQIRGGGKDHAEINSLTPLPEVARTSGDPISPLHGCCWKTHILHF